MSVFQSKSWRYWMDEWIKPILIAAVLAFLIRTFITQPFKIPSTSMYPTLKVGDRIFVSKFIYGAKVPFTDIRLPDVREPELGDIVVFLSPIEKKKFLIKRFIAGGGDTVQIKDGHVYVNGVKVDEDPMKRFFYYNRGKYGRDGEVINVPEGSFYVLGDNSANSQDSRFWGFVPEENLVGKAYIIHWPPRRIQILGDGD